jgi:ABC-2 type transport system ATP-binding protein
MISVEHLSKRFGALTAVDDVSFTVQPGTVAGFLGPNGAGKSTTLRCLIGLTRPDSGRSTVLGHPYAELDNPGSRVGVLLDAGAQHVGRTGAEILHLGATVIGVERSRVDEVLDAVQLTKAEAKRRFGAYSLGMRQRLGIAHALLGSPEVLILDEPANGLDPQGIVWMRTLLRGFADNGGTVLLSSHQLYEVQQIADSLILLGGGRVVGDGTVAELLTNGQSLEEIFFELTAPTSRANQNGAAL